MLSALAIANYRSLRQLTVPLGSLTVVTGANGSGKSSVYRAMRLLADIANGGVIRSLVREGGLSSTLWAGPERFSAAMLRGEQPVQGTTRSEPVALKLGFAGAEADDFGYAIDIGRDGMLSGINIDATVKLAQALTIPVIASGGLSNMADIDQLCAVESEGVEGVICGRAIYSGDLDFAAAQARADELAGA